METLVFDVGWKLFGTVGFVFGWLGLRELRRGSEALAAKAEAEADISAAEVMRERDESGRASRTR